MTEEGHTVDDQDPSTAPKPQPSEKPRGEPRDFPHHDPASGSEAPLSVEHSEPPEYAPGEDPYERDEP